MNILKRFYIACIRFRHRHGYGVHSPFAFDLITGVIYGRYHFYAYESLFKQRLKLSLGLPHYSIRVDKLLFRLVNRFQPNLVVEVGTGSGLSIRYMAAAKKEARYVTFDVERHEDVSLMLKEASVEYQTFHAEDAKELLQNFPSIDLLHIAHTPNYEAVFEEALSHVSSKSLFVVEGIYESEAKLAWWKQIVADSRTGVTFDLYEMGLVFFDTSRPKQHYVA